MRDSLEKAQRDNDSAQLALRNAHLELEKRITEHDTCVAERKPEELVRVTLDLIHEAEGALEEAKGRAAEAAEALRDAKLAQRRAEAAEKGEARAGGERPPPLCWPPRTRPELRPCGASTGA